MKTFLLFIVSFCTCTALASGQNSVTVNQQGSGNSVHITQSASNTPDKDCTTSTAAKDDSAMSSILVVKGSATQDTVAHQSEIHLNTVLNNPLLPWLSAIQQGAKNSLLIFTDDSAADVSSKQTGTQNSITAWLQSTPDQQITLKQNGENNTIKIDDPCTKERK